MKRAPLVSSTQRAGQRHAILFCYEQHWQAHTYEWREQPGMTNDRKHALNMYWQGSGEIEIKGRKWPIQAPCCVLREPNQTTKSRWQPGVIEESWLILPGIVVDWLRSAEQLRLDQPVVPIHDVGRMRLHVTALNDCMQNPSVSWPQVVAQVQVLTASLWGAVPMAEGTESLLPDRVADQDARRIADAVRAAARLRSGRCSV